MLALPDRVIVPGEVYHMDALELLARLPAGSVDAVITDPPYGFGLDVWDNSIDVEAFAQSVYRVLKPDGFFAFFQMMPYAQRWLEAIGKTPLRFVDHVVWVKRNMGAYSAGLCRAHESLFIYRKGAARYIQVKGRYEDVKVPGVLFDVVTIQGIMRAFDALRSQVNGGKRQIKHSGDRHPAHKRRGDWESERAPEMANFTNVWSFLPAFQTDTEYDKNHASRKPLLLMNRAIELLTRPGDLVVDPFCGSGTTLVAARNLGRLYIGGDITPEYVTVARERLAEPYTASFLTTEDREPLPTQAALWEE